MAEVREIITRVWTRIIEFDVERSFTCGAGYDVLTRDVVLGQGWSLFTFDFKRGSAVFLRTPDGIDLSRAPFVYNLQFERATYVAVVSFDELLDITEALPDIPNLVQFFSTGHCGSTLLHNVFNAVPGVWCVSEPMSFNALALNSGGVDDVLKLQLARAALRLLARFQGRESTDRLVIKHFSQSTTQLRLLSEAQPQSKNLFLYRDALGWTNSFYRFVQNYGTSMMIPLEQRSLLWRLVSGGMSENFLEGLLDLHADVLTFDRLSAVAWSTHMQHFAKARGDGLSYHALRYNELISQREETLTQVFAYLDLPREAVAATLSVFEKNAHEGTRSERRENDLHFNDENYAVVRSILAHPQIAMDPDMIFETA